MYNDNPGRYRMFLSVWCQLPGPPVLLFMGPGPAPAPHFSTFAFRHWAGFVKPFLVTSRRRKTQSSDTKNNFLAIACHRVNWERRVCLESKGGRQVHVAEGETSWLAVAMREEWLLMCVCACVRVCACVWFCVPDNPGESLSLKGNRCRFTYVEGPQPVMRLAGWDLSSQQLEGAYLINAWS